MNNSTLRLRDPCNSYKCYDSIPTPSPISNNNCINNEGSQKTNGVDSLRIADNIKQLVDGNGNNNNKLHRPASLDSLINSSEQDSSSDTDEDADNQLSDSDSLTELQNISNSENKATDTPRKSDIEGLKNDIEPPKEPVIKAYLEKSHKKCDYKNCGFKKTEPNSLDDIEVADEYNSPPPLCCLSSNNQLKSGPPSSSVKSNRRTSIASSGSVGRMETIIEEPLEAKVSVKEILARFETLREAAEVINNSSTVV